MDGTDNSPEFREECGVVGIWNEPEASRLAYLGLYAIQHRGQESAGIVTLQDGRHKEHKGLGLVADVFKENDLDRLSGHAAIGHVRYSTTGENYLSNTQPLTAELLSGPVAIAHNGNIVNAHELRHKLKDTGSIFQGTNDTECLLHLIARHESYDTITCLKDSLRDLEGAYSLVLLTSDKLIAARDPNGFRPLVLGRRKNKNGGDSVIIASETCAFDLVGAEYIREIKPGEIFWVDQNGEHSVQLDKKATRLSPCIFEHIYFARPDSVVFGNSVYAVRKECGRILARENAVEADVVIPVPDSGVPSALGYSEASGIPFELGIIRNHYVGRTFIEPKQSIRDFGVKVKLNPQSSILAGKRVIVVDDSLVRGTTSRKLVGLIRQAGAKEVHLRIASPPTTGACYYGVDTPKRTQLIASQKSVEEIRKFVEADSLGYLSLEGMYSAVKNTPHCAACFDGKYPTDLFSIEKDKGL
jgi:amidophosphoribosyltransferase